MTLNEAIADIETVSRGRSAQLVLWEETTCVDTQQAIRLLATAYEYLRKRDPLYADRRRSRSLGPPPGSVPPG
jgi:hypothetical protein